MPRAEILTIIGICNCSLPEIVCGTLAIACSGICYEHSVAGYPDEARVAAYRSVNISTLGFAYWIGTILLPMFGYHINL